MGRLRTSPEEYVFIEDFKKYGVAKKTSGSSLDQYQKFHESSPGDIYAGCPDMDVLFNKFGFHFQTFGRKLHPCMAVHGGGSGIHPKSPLNACVRFPIDYFCHHVILAGSEGVKNTRRVCVYDHIGCGAARLAGLTPPQQIELNLLGRGFLEESLRERGKEFEVVPLLYCYYGTPGVEQDFDEHLEETFILDLDAWFDSRSKWMDSLLELPIRIAEPLVA